MIGWLICLLCVSSIVSTHTHTHLSTYYCCCCPTHNHHQSPSAIAPLYKEMSEEYDTVVFLKVDVDETPDTAAKYSVSAMPTFLFLKGGKVVDRLQGANPQKLRDMIEQYM